MFAIAQYINYDTDVRYKFNPNTGVWYVRDSKLNFKVCEKPPSLEGFVKIN